MIYVNGKLPTINQFESGEQNVVLETDLVEGILDDDHLQIYWKYQNDLEIMQLREILNIFDHVSCVDVNIPYFPHERMDRQQAGQANSLDAMLNLLPVTNQVGKIHYSTLEPHSKILMQLANEKGLDMYVEWFDHRFGQTTKLMILPDSGSVDRYLAHPSSQALIDYLQKDNEHVIVIGTKHRDFKSHEIIKYALDRQLIIDPKTHELTVKDITDPEIFWPRMRNVLRNSQSEIRIINDISSYGGTFIRIKEQLEKALGTHFVASTELVLRVAHAERAILKGRLLDEFDRIITTDSIIDRQDADMANYQVGYQKILMESTTDYVTPMHN